MREYWDTYLLFLINTYWYICIERTITCCFFTILHTSSFKMSYLSSYLTLLLLQISWWRVCSCREVSVTINIKQLTISQERNSTTSQHMSRDIATHTVKAQLRNIYVRTYTRTSCGHMRIYIWTSITSFDCYSALLWSV